jgi:hypothetical protein
MVRRTCVYDRGSTAKQVGHELVSICGLLLGCNIIRIPMDDLDGIYGRCHAIFCADGDPRLGLEFYQFRRIKEGKFLLFPLTCRRMYVCFLYVVLSG